MEQNALRIERERGIIIPKDEFKEFVEFQKNAFPWEKSKNFYKMNNL